MYFWVKKTLFGNKNKRCIGSAFNYVSHKLLSCKIM